MPYWSATSVALVGWLAASCSGTLGGEAEPGGTGGPVVPGATAPAIGIAPPSGDGSMPPGSSLAPGQALTCTVPNLGPTPLRRLTHLEYENAVAALLGEGARPSSPFPSDNRVGLFDNTAAVQTVPVLLAERYVNSAASVAEDISDVAALSGCDAESAGCAEQFIGKFGRRAYRRPLTSEESARLLQIFNETSDASDGETGIRALVATMLASPNFLYRAEFGVGPSSIAGAQSLSQFELAARLASLVWASIPDETLLDAAQAGELGTQEQVATQARRMLAEPAARSSLANFYKQWLGFDAIETTSKDPTLFPDFDESLRESLREETERFIEHVLWEDGAKLTQLFSAPYTFVDGRLASLYDLPAPADPNSFEQVSLVGAPRAGVVTQASLLAALSSPTESSLVKRGAWLRTRILCQDLPDPPAGVPELPEPEPGVTTRERFEVHTSTPACSGCHNLIDGLGFGLEEYDSVGRHRTMDNGAPVDTNGEVTATLDMDGPYQGGAQLAQMLAGSNQVQDCAATQWLRFAFARKEMVDDACSLKSARESLAASGGDLNELLVALTQTDAFWNYKPAQ